MDPLVEFLAPDLRAARHRLPCGALGAALHHGRSPDFAGRGGHEVLLLTAFIRNVLVTLGEDVRGMAEPIPDQGELYRHRSARRDALCGRDLPLPLIRDGERPVLLARTYALLAQLPMPLVRRLLAWAPPVVVVARAGEAVVKGALYGNFATALLARVACPDELVEIRVVEEGVALFPPAATVADLRALLASSLPVLLDLCEGHKQDIAALADGVLAGQWENRLQRAMTYRYRQRASAGIHHREPGNRG